jgi:hypothetical protein
LLKTVIWAPWKEGAFRNEDYRCATGTVNQDKNLSGGNISPQVPRIPGQATFNPPPGGEVEMAIPLLQ